MNLIKSYGKYIKQNIDNPLRIKIKKLKILRRLKEIIIITSTYKMIF